jgi:hypothetical protein
LPPSWPANPALPEKPSAISLPRRGRATAETLAKNGSPVRTIKIERLDEASLGELLMHFMLETIIAAHLFGVDAFDQPAVEEARSWPSGIGLRATAAEPAQIVEKLARPVWQYCHASPAVAMLLSAGATAIEMSIDRARRHGQRLRQRGKLASPGVDRAGAAWLRRRTGG